MDRSDIITLVSETQTQDANGIWRASYTENIVFCSKESITRAEFFDAGRNGLSPEYKFTIFFGDYNGERTVIYNGQGYAVYRTYHGMDDTLELYVQREGGTNGR